MNDPLIDQLKNTELPAPELDWKSIWIEMGKEDERQRSLVKLRQQRRWMGAITAISSVAATVMLFMLLDASQGDGDSNQPTIRMAEPGERAEPDSGESDVETVPKQQQLAVDAIGQEGESINNRIAVKENMGRATAYPLVGIGGPFSTAWSAPSWLQKKRVLERAAAGDLGEIEHVITPSKSLSPVLGGSDPDSTQTETPKGDSIKIERLSSQVL